MGGEGEDSRIRDFECYGIMTWFETSFLTLKKGWGGGAV